MDVVLLTPAGALVGLLVALPLAALVAGNRRTARVAAAIGLPPAPGGRGRLLGLALVAVGALLAAAAAQPVVERGAAQRPRPSAEVFVVLDNSRSMLARTTPDSVPRFERARAAALRLRGEFPDVPVGLASMTDRVLPHLFPTSDVRAYRSTLVNALGVDRPPPSVRKVVATSLDAVASLATRNFFARGTDVRVAILLSDFESAPYAPAELAIVLGKERVRLVLLRVGDASERIFETAEDARYAPDPNAGRHADQLARASGGRAFGEGQVAAAAAAARDELAGAEQVLRLEERESVELAPWLALAALLPVGFVLARRNLP